MDGLILRCRSDGGFHETLELMKSKDEASWRKLTYWIFDIPTKRSILEDRQETLKQQKLPDFIKITPYFKCDGIPHLYKIMKDIIRREADGLILRKPASYYHSGRSPHLLRVQVPKNLSCL
jgi:DNA ligase-1